jgi:hypothetical protein
MHVTRSHSVVLLLVTGVLLLLMLAAGPAAPAGPRSLILDPDATPSWVETVAGPAAGTDSAADLLLLKNGVMLVCGTLTNASGNTDISVTRYRNGVQQWTQSWNGPANGSDSILTLSPARKMALSPDGKYVYVCGHGTRAGGNIDLYVLKRRVSNGNLVWARRYDGPAHKNDVATGIGVDAAGNVIVVGTSANDADGDYVVASWKASGAKRWTWRWDGKAGADIPFDVLVTGVGDTYVTGASEATGGRVRAVTARLTRSGAKKWVKKWFGDAGLGAAMSSLALRPGGGVYAGGWVTNAATANDAIVIKYTARGGRSTLGVDPGGGGATAEMYWDIAVLSTKAVVGVGHTQFGALQQPRVAIFSAAGAPLFSGTRGTAGSDSFVACATDAIGGWYAVATIHDNPATTRLWTFRGSVLSSAGAWASEFSPAASAENAARNIAVRDASCGVVGQGQSGGPTGIDQLVLMYNY